jgi:hypothetical protein
MDKPDEVVTLKSDLPRQETFLRTVESRTADPYHHRLLKACRQSNPGAALEEELSRIIDEILHEAH